MAQLLFWRPVPSFEASPEAIAPSVEMVDLQRPPCADAVAAGQLGPGAADEALDLVARHRGVLSQALANEPDVAWGEGRFSPLLPKLLDPLAAFPPVPGPASSAAVLSTGRCCRAGAVSGLAWPAVDGGQDILGQVHDHGKVLTHDLTYFSLRTTPA